MRKTILFLLLISSLGTAVYFNSDFVRLYNDLTNRVLDFQKTEIGTAITEISREVLTSTPLKVTGRESGAVLVKSKVIEETNIQRQNNGLPALLENSKLNQAAFAKANDMFQKQYFEHESPTGDGPGEIISRQGYEYIAVGENLILGNFSSEKEVVEKWMASPGHRANILNKKYTEIGAAVLKGIYNGESVWIGVQEFGLPLSACDQPDINLKNKIDSIKSEIDIFSEEIEEKKNQINNTDPRKPVYNQMVEDYNQLIARYNLLTEDIKLKIANYNNQVNIFNNCVAGN
jgi:uncharacterized protein YkwD